MTNLDDRLSRLEKRLAEIETRLGIESRETEAPKQAPSETTTPVPTPLPRHQETAQRPAVQPRPPVRRPGATTILGWSGVAALVLAAAYLIRLAIDSGFLTPVRQVGIALMAGVVMIAVGIFTRPWERRYMGLLPAGGIAILFLTAYGAHHYHGLIGAGAASVGVMVVAAIALGLREITESEFYTFFAVIAAYTIPLLLPGLRPWAPDLYIHFIAWGLIFSWFAIRVRNRNVYLLAAYLAFIVFDAVWTERRFPWWEQEAIFLVVQFLIFASATVIYSVRHRSPLDTTGAFTHLPALLIFYFLEYTVLHRHVPEWAPWAALASAGVLAAIYGLARSFIKEELRAGRTLVLIYAAVALFHAGYVDLLPDEWRPWVVLVSVLIAAAVVWKRPKTAAIYWPLGIAILAGFLHNELRVLSGVVLDSVHAWQVLILLYAVLPYVAYALRRRNPASVSIDAGLLLALGHANTMTAAIHLFDSRLIVSSVWGILAVTCLVTAISIGDQRLGRSALLIYAASGLKVLLFDLSGASPLVRIGCLVVLGITLYAGGLLYKRIQTGEPSPV